MDNIFAVTWDEKHLKALLGLRRHPLRLIQVEPWLGWIKQRGGLNQVRQSLRNSDQLTPIQRSLLGLIIEHPDAPVLFYCSKLNVSQSTYFLYLSNLVDALLLHLNSWESYTEPARRKWPAQRTNLPAPLTPLVGADGTVASVVAMLQRSGARLLTLMGPGGVGKTRLSIAVGTNLLETFRDGVFFIPLETINDHALLVPQIARSLELERTGSQSLLDVLKTYLRGREILLILDNFEQLVDSSFLLVELLQSAPSLKIITTSREALNQYGEYRFVVPELTHPGPDNPLSIDQPSQWTAVDLFVQRVQALQPAFALSETNKDMIARLCYHLDGLPLAIELAAAQFKSLAPGQTVPSLEYDLKSLRDTFRERPVRQKTLWDAIDWSYRLLPEAEQALFRKLSVFGRMWDLDAAQTICEIADGPASIARLVDKSLVRYAAPAQDGMARFEMLQAVREYALNQLEANGERQATQRRHLVYYLDFVKKAEIAIGTAHQPLWAERIKQEHENLQIALGWGLEAGQTALVFDLLGGVWRYWDMLNIWSEARLWADRALSQGTSIHSTGRALTLWGASWLAAHQSDYAQGLALAREGLALARSLGEKRLTGLLLQSVADGLYRFDERDQAITLAEESLAIFRALNDREETAWALSHLARGVWMRGEHAHSMALLQEGLSIFRSMEHPWGITSTLNHIGRLASLDRQDDLAVETLTESLDLSRLLGAKQGISENLRELAMVMWRRGDFDKMRAMLEESRVFSSEIGDRVGEGWALNLLGRFALEQLDLRTARQLLEKAQALFQAAGEPVSISYNQGCLEKLALAESRQE